jgi:hypothetical protein
MHKSTTASTATGLGKAKRENVKDIFPAVVDVEADAEVAKTKQTTSPLQSPALSDGNPESSRRVSFQKALCRRDAAQNGASSPKLVTSSSSRRAFAALDPTSSHHPSGTATPRTVRSVKSPSSSRASSQVDLASLSAVDANGHSPSPALSSASKDGDVGHTSGAMPALDAALARAEDKSGLKTSSRCMACTKRVVNAPVSRNGDVFCSRECRIETKRERQAAAKETNETTTTSTSNDVVAPNEHPVIKSTTSPAHLINSSQGSTVAARV